MAGEAHLAGHAQVLRDAAQPRDLGRAALVGLGRVAKALALPTLLTSSNAQWQNGDTLPELVELFPDLPIYRRT